MAMSDKKTSQNLKVTIGTKVGDPAFVIAFSYKKAADTLLKKERQLKVELEQDIFPIVFLYRHSIELYLKAIYLTYSKDDKQTKADTIQNCSHSIHKIFNYVDSLIVELSKEMNYKDTQILKELRKDTMYIHNLDQTSFDFRYSWKLNLEQIHELPKQIDVTEFKNATDRIHDHLGAVLGAFDHYEDCLKSLGGQYGLGNCFTI